MKMLMLVRASPGSWTWLGGLRAILSEFKVAWRCVRIRGMMGLSLNGNMKLVAAPSLITGDQNFLVLGVPFWRWWCVWAQMFGELGTERLSCDCYGIYGEGGLLDFGEVFSSGREGEWIYRGLFLEVME
jgi:hypothetical protein